jgi:biopolymer transport protein ExbB/TolQ
MESMAEFFSWTSLMQSGGITLILLFIVFLSITTIIIERAFYYRANLRFNMPEGITEQIARGDYASIAERLRLQKHPAAYVLAECLEIGTYRKNIDAIAFDEVKERGISEKLPEMERYLNVLAIFGTVSPYIGLLGTVFGIIRAFVSLDQSGSGMEGLNTGIAEALVATAAGLFVAIPSTIGYNVYRKKTDALILSIEILASRLKMLIVPDHNG